MVGNESEVAQKVKLCTPILEGEKLAVVAVVSFIGFGAPTKFDGDDIYELIFPDGSSTST